MILQWLKRQLTLSAGSSLTKQLSGRYINNTDLLAIDVELTSLDAKATDITSIGWVAGKGGQLSLSSCEYFVINTSAALGQSPVIHGLTHDILAQGKPLAVSLDKLMPLLQSSVLVFHNASLDLAALNKAFIELSLPVIDVIYIDTLKLAVYQLSKQHQVLPTNSATLTVCRQRLDLPSCPEHNALDDALATIQLLFAQFEQFGLGQSSPLSQLLHTKALGKYRLGETQDR